MFDLRRRGPGPDPESFKLGSYELVSLVRPIREGARHGGNCRARGGREMERRHAEGIDPGGD
jgi:hypothetical protein